MVWSTTPEIARALKGLPLELLPSIVNAAFSLPYPKLSVLLETITMSPPLSPIALAERVLELTSSTSLTEPEFSASTTLEVCPPPVIAIQPQSVALFPLKLSHADSYLGLPTKEGKNRRTVLVGDAAHTVHPMAGQGMNMGLGDVRALVDTLEKCVEEGGDIGSFCPLRLLLCFWILTPQVMLD